MEQGNLRICTEVKPHTDLATAHRAIEENPRNEPFPTLQGIYTTETKWSLAILTGKHWGDGREITIKFMSGVDPRVAAKIREVAELWLDHINLTFKWATSVNDPAQIRIATVQGDGSWSYLGLDNLNIPQSKPTMNFGWLTPNSDYGEYKRVVLHEFGHMLGFPHEHQLPDADFQWDREAVYALYTKPPNSWSKADIDWNVLNRYSEDQIRGGRFDRESIMLYPIPNSLTVGNYEVGWNTELSDGDKKWASTIYPKTPEPVEPEPVEPEPVEPEPVEPEPPVDPLAGLPRVSPTGYVARKRWTEECVIRTKGLEVAHSRPLEH